MFKILVLSAIGGLSFLFGSLFGQQSDPIKEKVIQNAVIGILNQYHYEPEEIDDEFSSEAFDFFLEYIDSRKRFFTKEDIAQLEPYRLLIDDQINSGSFEFFDLATELLNQKVEEAESYYQEILDNPFNFEIDEEFQFDPENLDWAKDNGDLKDRWRKQLKYDAIVALNSRLAKQEKALEEYENPTAMESGVETNKEFFNAVEEKEKEEEDILAKSYEDLEAESRDKVLADYQKWYKNFDKVRRSDRFEAYINTFAHMFDPHSDYFNPKEKEDFDISMGGKLEGIGARLRTDGDLTKVVSIVPGGPVWRSDQIEVNDFILKVKQKGEEPLDIFGMRIDDVVSKIRGKKGTWVTLSVQKKDGSVVEVDLERDVINIEESFVKSAIIDLDDVIDNVGYIDLPKFYSSFEGPEGNSCAADVAAEIEKLKRQNINGIILDLRNNGGGSLKDVVDMSGLFIEGGPIVQVKPRNRRPYIYKDEDESVRYTGPLIVMINSFSASASEILAAAMQDYDRAIVIGSQSFGKGTVQRFIDLDKAVKGNNDFKPLGQLKLTMQKFYRIDGGSTQLKGVTPDIFLPDRYRLIDVGEREYDNALDWSQLSSLDFEQEVHQVANREFLRKNSVQRLANSEEFASIYKQGEWFRESRDQKAYALNLEEYRDFIEERKKRSAEFKDIMSTPIDNLNISNLPEDLEEFKVDETTKARNESWIEDLNKDIYVEEALYILRDMVNGRGYTLIPDKKD